MHRRLISALALVLVAAIGFAACNDDDTKAEKQRKEAIHQRAEAFARATAAVPTPHTSNFPLRKALAEFTKRQDELNHPWYIYVVADTGNVIGYYVGKTVPINACDFLSSTQQVLHDDNGNLILSSPSLDGIFYGGSGSSSGCDAWFFFDQTTNALIQIRGVNFFSADKPLALSAEPITVAP